MPELLAVAPHKGAPCAYGEGQRYPRKLVALAGRAVDGFGFDGVCIYVMLYICHGFTFRKGTKKNRLMYKYDKYCEKRFSRRCKKILKGVPEYLLTLLHAAC